MFSALYAMVNYGGIEYGMRGPVTVISALSEVMTASDSVSAMTAFKAVVTESALSAATLGNIVETTPTPPFRTFQIPAEKRNLS